MGSWARQGRRLWIGRDGPVVPLISLLRGAQMQMSFVWQPYALSLGLSMRELGGLESARDLTMVSAQPLIGAASDEFGRKAFLILRELLLVAAMALLLLARTWTLLLAAFLLVGLSLAADAVWSSLVAESAEGNAVGRAYSFAGAPFIASGLFAPAAAGFLATSFGYDAVLYLSAGLGLSATLLIKLRLREGRRGGSSGFRIARVFGESLRPPRNMRGFYLSMAIDAFAFGLGSRLLFGMLTKSYGYSPYMLGLLATALTAAWAAAMVPLGFMVDRAGYRRFLLLGQAVSCVVLAGILASKRFEVILLLQALLGVSAALWSPAEQAWVASGVRPERRGRSIGGYLMIKSLAAFPAPYVGGLLYEAFGFDAPILANLVLAILDFGLIVLLVEERKAPEAEAAS